MILCTTDLTGVFLSYGFYINVQYTEGNSTAFALSVLTLLVGRQEGHPARKN